MMVPPMIYYTIVSLLAESKSGAQALREVWSIFSELLDSF